MMAQLLCTDSACIRIFDIYNTSRLRSISTTRYDESFAKTLPRKRKSSRTSLLFSKIFTWPVFVFGFVYNVRIEWTLSFRLGLRNTISLWSCFVSETSTERATIGKRTFCSLTDLNILVQSGLLLITPAARSRSAQSVKVMRRLLSFFFTCRGTGPLVLESSS